MAPKDLVVKLRLTQADRERLARLAEYYATSASGAMRMLIAEKVREIEEKTR